MQTKIDVLKECTVNGNVIYLPTVRLDRKLYQEVANALELIGGKWKGGKVMGFVFPHDPTELLQTIANGEKKNLKKEFQFFATPARLARQLAVLADLQQTDTVFEPSAGQGAIIKAIREIGFTGVIHYCELMPVNQIFCYKLDNVNFVKDDFLKLDDLIKTKPVGMFDKIIANPPFAKNQDIDHIHAMYKHLKPGGRMVTLSSPHWQICDNKKEKAFREWLDSLDAEITPIDAGEFKESGTAIATVMIIINKDKKVN